MEREKPLNYFELLSLKLFVVVEQSLVIEDSVGYLLFLLLKERHLKGRSFSRESSGGKSFQNYLKCFTHGRSFNIHIGK
jgi:hypothetical protein